MLRSRCSWLGLASALLLALWMGALSGCAPRLLEKSPGSGLQYPFIPVSPQELESFKAELAKDPRGPEAPKARYWIAQEAFNRAAYAEAEKGFLAVVKNHPRSEWAGVAGVMTARVLVKQRKGLAALAQIAKVEKTSAADPGVLSACQDTVHQIINEELTLAELTQVRTLYPNTAWDQEAFFVTGKRHLDGGNPDQAKQSFEQFLATFPQSVFAPQAKDLLERAGQIIPVNRFRVGVLLPLSGAYAPFGQAVQQGLDLALQQANQRRAEGERLSLAYADTQGTTLGAVQGLNLLADTEKVIAVIGPVLSTSARAILPDLDRSRLCVITPSAADPGLSALSSHFFRYMLTNQAQAQAIASYAVLKKNRMRFGILHAEDPYDRSLAEAFEAKVKELGGQVVAHVEYPRGTIDFKPQMLALGGTDPGIMKELEVTERKQLEQQLEAAAFSFANHIAPPPAEPTQTPGNLGGREPLAAPTKRVAIVRLQSFGPEAENSDLAKVITEKFSYTLAARPGFEVLTQDHTFEALRKLGLTAKTLTAAEWPRLGNELGVDYFVFGSVSQTVQDLPAAVATPVVVANQPIPIRYHLVLQLVRSEGTELKRFERDWVKSVTPVRNTINLEAIYLPVSANDAVLIASQLDFYDLQCPIFGSDAWLAPTLLRQGGEVLDTAVIAVSFWPDDPTPEVQGFVKAFEEAYSQTPSSLSLQAFDTLNLVETVLRRLRPALARREDFQSELIKLHQYTGVSGLAEIGQDGEIRRTPVFLEISNGKLKRIP